MGAADVVPFIPIEGVTLADCVAMAKQAGAEIWKRYGVPVYLYEAAATRPERQGLENVRKGQFEGIRAEIATKPERLPDFGEAALHATAGITAVGARKALIAYNVFLEYAGCRDRKEGREGGAVLDGWPAICEGRRVPGARHGAGVDEPDGL